MKTLRSPRLRFEPTTSLLPLGIDGGRTSDASVATGGAAPELGAVGNQ